MGSQEGRGVTFMCGGPPPGPPMDDATAARLLLEHPEMGWCCYGAASDDGLEALRSCTCWEPVYDLVQRELTEGAPAERPEPCGDCAYRADSPERRGDAAYNGDEYELERLVREGVPFFCHQGIRQPVRWRHPCGAELPGSPANYWPPQRRGEFEGQLVALPYKANGHPADVCAGWAARRRVLVS